LLKLANVGKIKCYKALEIINQVLHTTQKWSIVVREVGVSKLETKNIGEALSKIYKNTDL
jgi:hypothetical protein